MAQDKAVDTGMWGGPEGGYWECNGDIQKIHITHGVTVHSLTFTYINLQGENVESIKFGGGGGADADILLDSGEYLVTIKGAVGTYNGHQVVTSLTFVTNKQPNGVGPFGRGDGTKFSLPVVTGKIAGFYGRASDFVNAIGIRLVPSTGSRMVKLGYWGGTVGNTTPWAFDDEIKTIQVSSGGMIDSITFNGTYKAGGDGGTKRPMIALESGEYLKTIDGATYGCYPNLLCYLRIFTNKQTYGPYGSLANSVPFDVPVKNGKITSFSGKSGVYIDEIGFGVIPVAK